MSSLCCLCKRGIVTLLFRQSLRFPNVHCYLRTRIEQWSWTKTKWHDGIGALANTWSSWDELHVNVQITCLRLSQRYSSSLEHLRQRLKKMLVLTRRREIDLFLVESLFDRMCPTGTSQKTDHKNDCYEPSDLEHQIDVPHAPIFIGKEGIDSFSRKRAIIRLMNHPSGNIISESNNRLFSKLSMYTLTTGAD